MWIMTKFGVVSVTETPVEHAQTGRELQIRSRDPKTLKHLRKIMGRTLTPSITTAYSDYPFRAFCTKADFALAMTKMITEIDYTNFKNSVVNNRLHDMYMQVWSAYNRAYEVLRPRVSRK